MDFRKVNTRIAQYLTKGNQTMKFDQLIEDNKKDIFLKIVHKMRQRD